MLFENAFPGIIRNDVLKALLIPEASSHDFR